MHCRYTNCTKSQHKSSKYCVDHKCRDCNEKIEDGFKRCAHHWMELNEFAMGRTNYASDKPDKPLKIPYTNRTAAVAVIAGLPAAVDDHKRQEEGKDTCVLI